MTLTVSEAQAFFTGQAFKASQKAKEAEIKLQVAQIERLNGVIRAIGGLAKALSR